MPQMRYEVYADDDLAADVESYAETNDTSLSAAWKELARRGLQALEVEQ